MTLEQLRQQYNAAVANGVIMRARQIDRQMQSIQRKSK